MLVDVLSMTLKAEKEFKSLTEELHSYAKLIGNDGCTKLQEKLPDFGAQQDRALAVLHIHIKNMRAAIEEAIKISQGGNIQIPVSFAECIAFSEAKDIIENAMRDSPDRDQVMTAIAEVLRMITSLSDDGCVLYLTPSHLYAMWEAIKDIDDPNIRVLGGLVTTAKKMDPDLATA